MNAANSRSYPRTMEAAISRIVELGETNFGFRRDFPDDWYCGTCDVEGGFILTGNGKSPLDAAWALVEAIEKHQAWAAEYFAKGNKPSP